MRGRCDGRQLSLRIWGICKRPRQAEHQASAETSNPLSQNRESGIAQIQFCSLRIEESTLASSSYSGWDGPILNLLGGAMVFTFGQFGLASFFAQAPQPKPAFGQRVVLSARRRNTTNNVFWRK